MRCASNIGLNISHAHSATGATGATLLRGFAGDGGAGVRSGLAMGLSGSALGPPMVAERLRGVKRSGRVHGTMVE